MSVFIEIAYGEHLHFSEKVITYTHKGGGGYLHHYALIKQRRESAESVNDYHHRKQADEGFFVPAACFQSLFDVVDYGLEQIVAHYPCARAEKYADDNYDQSGAEAVHIAEYPFQRSKSILWFCRSILRSWRHYSSAPFCCES